MSKRIAILCANEDSEYFKFEGLDIYTQKRPISEFKGGMPIIAHPPCAQWGKFKWRSKKDIEDKMLALQCIEHLAENGGIMEHPASSDIWKRNFPEGTRMYKIHMSDWGYKAKKETILAFYQVKPITMPIQFNAIQGRIELMDKKERAVTPYEMCKWLITCIDENYSGPHTNSMHSDKYNNN